MGFEREGELHMERTNAWIAKLLQEKGTDIYRMKGVLAMQGCDDKYVYQGVHMLFTGEVPAAKVNVAVLGSAAAGHRGLLESASEGLRLPSAQS